MQLEHKRRASAAHPALCSDGNLKQLLEFFTGQTGPDEFGRNAGVWRSTKQQTMPATKMHASTVPMPTIKLLKLVYRLYTQHYTACLQNILHVSRLGLNSNRHCRLSFAVKL